MKGNWWIIVLLLASLVAVFWRSCQDERKMAPGYTLNPKEIAAEVRIRGLLSRIEDLEDSIPKIQAQYQAEASSYNALPVQKRMAQVKRIDPKAIPSDSGAFLTTSGVDSVYLMGLKIVALVKENGVKSVIIDSLKEVHRQDTVLIGEARKEAVKWKKWAARAENRADRNGRIALVASTVAVIFGLVLVF